MKLYYWTLLIVLVSISCKNDNNQNDGDYAFIGGEIINANNNFVVLSKSEHIIDTVKLNGNNRFVYKIKNLEAGLYQFKHGGEFQIVLLEPNDSIMFRLNTLEFDESLVYTGEGAKKNNYLINEYLRNEAEEKTIYKYCQLNPEDFENKIDSLKAKKTKKLKAFKSKYDTSDVFDKLAESNIDYSYYLNKEIYPFFHYGNKKNEILESLPEDFYNYRKNINYSDNLLKDYHYYNSFLHSNLDNVSLSQHYKHSKNKYFKRNDVCYNLDRLAIIDSLVSDNNIKEELLYHYTIRFLYKSKHEKHNNTILKYYLSKSENTESKDMITRFTNSINKLKTGASLPEVKLVNCKNTELSVNTIIDSPTVICFWSQTFYKHFKESHHKINELKIKYPEVNFVIINIDDYGLESSHKTLKRNRFSFNDEYQFKNPKTAKEDLAIYAVTKTFIVDKKQRIVNSNANIFNMHFEKELLGLINR